MRSTTDENNCVGKKINELGVGRTPTVPPIGVLGALLSAALMPEFVPRWR